jgi:hypothetical protein
VAVVGYPEEALWPITVAISRHELQFIPDLNEISPASLPAGAWPKRPVQAVVLPLQIATDTSDGAVLIAGLNPFRQFDEDYSRFFDLVVSQLATSIATAEAYEAERRRAQAVAEIDRAKPLFSLTPATSSARR